MNYEWFIGLRYLKAKRKQTFISIITLISIIGFALGVWALIVVLAVMSGFEKTLKEKILGTQAHLVVLKANQEGMDQYEEVVKEVEQVKGIASATPFILSQVMLSSESNVFGVVLNGIDPDRVGKVIELARNMKAGRLQDLKAEGESPGIILGVELAKRLGVSISDPIQVISPLGTMTPMGMMPKMKPFRVVGIFYSGMYEFDNTLAYISISSAQKFLNMDSRVTGIEIKTDDIYNVKKIGKEIRQKLAPLLDEGLDGDESKPLLRPETGEGGDVYHPRPHCFSGRLQYYLHADHGGHGKK